MSTRPASVTFPVPAAYSMNRARLPCTKLGINAKTLRAWVTQAEVDQGTRPGVTTDDTQRLLQLEKENRELRRANEILRTASEFCAAVHVERRSTAN